MARINLLPWREAQKKQREKNFYLLLGLSFILALGTVAAIHMEMQNRIDFQNKRNLFMTQQIAMLDKQIEEIKSLEVEKTRLLNRMKVIQQLQKSRPEIVHLFEEIVTTTPEGAQLLQIELKGENIIIEGIAESNSRISNFMRNLDRSLWLKEPELIVINAEKREYPNSSWFSLKVKRSRPQ